LTEFSPLNIVTLTEFSPLNIVTLTDLSSNKLTLIRSVHEALFLHGCCNKAQSSMLYWHSVPLKPVSYLVYVVLSSLYFFCVL
jgi:hypothetical protein